ncbi:MAG: hypothetical protein ACOY3K_03140 [Candidatus Omnitrophota bacterium]
MIALQYILLIAFLAMKTTTLWAGEPTTEERLAQAEAMIAEGDLTQAKTEALEALMQDPESGEAVHMVARTLDLEISRAKESEMPRTLEEMSAEDKQDMAKTWLERAQTLFEIREYDQAMLAAEKVFLYEAGSVKASELLDRIKKKAIQEGKGESLLLSRIYEDEMEIRSEMYLAQAKRWMSAKRWGGAKLALEKILLLDPENREALRLYQQIPTGDVETT